jgi:hypothetical protein
MLATSAISSLPTTHRRKTTTVLQWFLGLGYFALEPEVIVTDRPKYLSGNVYIGSEWQRVFPSNRRKI